MTFFHHSLTSLIGITCATSLFAAVELIESPTADNHSFPLVRNASAAAIVLPPDAQEVVKIAVENLARDIAAVSGTKPDILTSPPSNPSAPRIELLFSPDLAGRWEAFRLSAKPGVLTIAASDRRGLAFGIYEISRRIGVSPWYWWADVPVKHRFELSLTTGTEPVDQPAVKYRGIFLNDEDWGLQPWAAKTYEPEVNDIGPKTYTRIFELLLRLRANTIWPAMHECTKAFHLIPGNAEAADRYAIILGSSHAEPMLRSNTSEWKLSKNDYNYLKNRDGVIAYWEQRVKERTSGESLFTIGMRGIHDSPIIGPKTQPERIATLRKIFAEQRDLLARYLGKGDPTRVGQIFCPYKEVLDDYNAGMKVPDDVTLVWPDDNFGYVRHFPTDPERKRPGGNGVYYHASYLGAPLSWLWIDTQSPALIWSEMTRAYEQGAKNVWIVNVGDIKNTERSTEFFLDLAWHADRANSEFPAQFIHKTAERDFGKEHANQIADILKRLQSINFHRKVEHLQWNLPLTPYQPTELNETEIHQRLEQCADLQHDSEELSNKLPAAARDAWFELVGYPVAITAAANERYFRTELARADVARGRSPDANQEATGKADKLITQLTSRYNNDIAKGKWHHMVTAGGVSGKWKRFITDSTTSLPQPTLANICPPALPAPTPLVKPDGAKPGDFIERDGVISIEPSHFTASKNLPSGAGWRTVPGLGRSGAAVTVLPSTAIISSTVAPSLDYRFYQSSNKNGILHVRLVPTYPLVDGRGLRLAISIDDDNPMPLAVVHGFDSKNKEWTQRVLSNSTVATLELPKLTSGWHTLHLIAVDPGIVVDKILIDLGGLKPSYDGPEETRLTSSP